MGENLVSEFMNKSNFGWGRRQTNQRRRGVRGEKNRAGGRADDRKEREAVCCERKKYSPGRMADHFCVLVKTTIERNIKQRLLAGKIGNKTKV